MENKSEKIIKKVEAEVKKVFLNEGTGHDYYHMIQVRDAAKKIAQKEGGDLFVIELSALLHDIADWKFNGGTGKNGINKAREILKSLGVDENKIKQICYIIENISFKGAKVKNTMQTKEGKIVQDADRLNTLGAMGIARTFAYGGMVGRPLYDPTKKPRMHKSFEDFKKFGNVSSINHFYEKLLLSKDMMNTKTAKKIAEGRHKFLKLYLKEFFEEWQGIK